MERCQKNRNSHQRIAATLPHRDSNSVKQNQNLVCYHYTMGQSEFCGRKGKNKF